MLLKRNDSINSNYDVIVIGGGLGGLTAANILGKNGHKVLLTEAHNKLGGFATWFYRDQKKHIFDVSLHGFPYGMVKTCRKYWGKDIANDIVQLKGVRFVNPDYEISSTFTREDFTDKLINHFKIKKETVESFFEYLFNMNFYDDNEMTNGQLFEKFFPGRNDIVRFLMEPIVYANGSTLEDPAITYGIVFGNFMRKGVYTFVGGTDGLIHKMKQELLNNNVDIKLNTKVDEVLIENKKVAGIRLKDLVIKSPVVLSNANIKATVLKLCGEEHFSSEFIEQTKKIRLNTSSCQVYMGIKPGEKLDFVGDLIFTSSDKVFTTENLLKPDTTCRTFSVYYPEGRPNTNMYSIVSSTNARWEDWFNLSDQEYEDQKQKLIDDTLECIENFIPNVKSKISHIEAATPLTIKKFTHHPHGTSFGTKFEGLDVSMSLNKQIEGLYHTGSVGIIMSGWLGAANYGAIQSNEIDSYLYQLNQSKEHGDANV